MRVVATAIVACLISSPSLAKHRHHHHHRHAVKETPTSGLMSFHGQSGQTASGRRWNTSELVAAHRYLPFGTKVRITRGSRSVVVTVVDRGPFSRGRIIDVTPAAFRQLGPLDAGVLSVKIETVTEVATAEVTRTPTPPTPLPKSRPLAAGATPTSPENPPTDAPSPGKQPSVDAYLCEVYRRTPTKRDSSGDFTWKDKAAASKSGRDVCAYVIGGINPKFREVLYKAGLKMDAQGIEWSIMSGFRDDYRQKIASGFKARVGNSKHGGSRATRGYGDGRAIDITSAPGTAIGRVLAFIDNVGRALGLYRPMPSADPMHVQARIFDGEGKKMAKAHKAKHRRTQLASRRHHRRHVRA